MPDDENPAPEPELPQDVAPPPNLGFGPGDTQEIQWFMLLSTGKVGAGTLYVPATAAGGVYIVAARQWVCWGPISPEDFQRNVATVLNTLSIRWAERAKGAN